MKPGKFTHAIAVLLSSISSLFGHGAASKAEPAKTSFSKRSEKPAGNNPVPNRVSSWDKQWSKNYGGIDDPDTGHRSNYIPVKFTPRLNPFYCALPYNDKAREGHR